MVFTKSDHDSSLISLPKYDNLSSFTTSPKLLLSINLNLVNDTEINNKRIRKLQLSHTSNRSINNTIDIVSNILPHNFFDPNLCPPENDPTKFVLSSIQHPKNLHVDIRTKFAFRNIHYMNVNSYHKNKGFLAYLVMLCLFSK